MYKFALIERFCRDHRLQVYMYGFMYFNNGKIPDEDYFPAIIKMFNITIKGQLKDKYQKFAWNQLYFS